MECDILAGHYNNKDSAEGTAGLLSSHSPRLGLCACVRACTRRPAKYIPGDPSICIPPPVTPQSPCTRFLISPLTNPFCAWIAAVMDTVWTHSANKPCSTSPFPFLPPSLPLSSSCKLLPLIASVGAVWHDDGKFRSSYVDKTCPFRMYFKQMQMYLITSVMLMEKVLQYDVLLRHYIFNVILTDHNGRYILLIKQY